MLAKLPRHERSSYAAIAERLHLKDGRPFFLGEDFLPNEELDGYCEYLLRPGRASPKTWKTYAHQASIFLRFLGAQGIDWLKARREDLDAYYTVRVSGEFQNAPPIKGRSWNVAAAAIVHLYEYAQDEHLIDQLPFKYIHRRSRFGRLVRVPDLLAKSNSEPITFISIPDYKLAWRPALAAGENAQRDVALVDLLISTGLRIAEALALDLFQIPDPDSIRFRGRKSVTIQIVGKGSKSRIVRVPKHVVRAIRFYIEEDRARAAEGSNASTKVFLSRNGRPLAVRTVQGLFQRISKVTGIKLAPHGCRHTFAVYQLDAMIKKLGRNLRELRDEGATLYRQLLNDPLRHLQLLLGHSSVSSTYIYLDFLEESEALVDESLAAWASWGEESGR